MVDPNRKINRLTEEDISFLDECEELFANRFSEEDEQFMAHCANPLCEPPVVMNFVNASGGGNAAGGGHFNQSYGRGRFNDNRANYRGGHGGGGGGSHRNRNYNRRPFDYRRDGGGEGQNNRYRHNNRNFRNASNRSDEQRSSAMHFRRDYGNFVPASSKDGAS